MVREIDRKTLHELLQLGATLVDVRESNEVLTEGRVFDDARHWPLSSFGARQCEISQTRPTIFYCRSGLRSLQAAEIASLWTSQDVYFVKEIASGSVVKLA